MEGGSRQVPAQASHEQAQKAKTEWLGGDLEVDEQENPSNQRDEQASEEPPQTLMVREHQEPDLPIDAANQPNRQQYVTDRRHWKVLMSRKETDFV